MPNHESPPLLTGELCSLARDQLKMQTSRSAALRELLLAELTKGVQANDRALARKAVLFDRALTPLALAILIDLAGRL